MFEGWSLVGVFSLLPTSCGRCPNWILRASLPYNHLTHHRPVSKQIRGYFRKVSQRLQDRVAAGRETDEAGHAEAEGESAEDRKTNHLTARVGEEVEALQQILYHFPKTPGGVPDAFLDIREGESVATLEKDGVEEDRDRSRSARPKDPVVVTIED